MSSYPMVPSSTSTLAVGLATAAVDVATPGGTVAEAMVAAVATAVSVVVAAAVPVAPAGNGVGVEIGMGVCDGPGVPVIVCWTAGN